MLISSKMKVQEVDLKKNRSSLSDISTILDPIKLKPNRDIVNQSTLNPVHQKPSSVLDDLEEERSIILD
jgi:hypothetical protein